MQNDQPIIKNPISKTAIKLISENFNSYNNQAAECNSTESLCALISQDFSKLCKQYISNAEQSVSDTTPTDNNTAYLLHYVFPDALKDLIILHRDIVLQLYIGSHKNIEKLASEMAVQKHFDACKEQIKKAVSYFTSKLDSEEKNLTTNLLKSKKDIDSKTKHHLSPWKIYLDQIEILLAQFPYLEGSNIKTKRNIALVREINSHINLVIDKITKESETLLQISDEAVSKISAKENIKEILTWIDDSVDILNKNDLNFQAEFTSSLENKINNLTSYPIPVGSSEGFLLEKKIDFNKNVKKWMDYKLLPLLLDLWEGNTNLSSYLKHSLLNLKSSLNLGKDNDNLILVETQLQSYQKINKTLLENTENQNIVIEKIRTMLGTEFLISNSYKSNEFLEVSIQNSFNQYSAETGNLLLVAQKEVGNLIAKFNNSYNKVILEDPQSKLEKASYCISQRMFKEANVHYDMLFLNKNFIGDLFLVSRTAQEEKLNETIKLWEDGFNKSILVVGNPLSGKSTYLENSVEKYFDEKIIKLTPNESVTIGGRKFKTTKNLPEALAEVKRNSYTKKTILLIDDLELWRDDTNSLIQNTRALIDFIESESDNVLVIVSTNPSMSSHLNKRCNFSNTFSTTININKCIQEEIFKAVLVRHAATHRTVVNALNEELTDAQIITYVTKLCKKLNNNIGEVLQAWTYGTTVKEDGSILYKENNLSFPDFFTKEEIIILKYTLLYNFVNEKILKEFTGNLYGSSIKSGLKRLINTKVLLRNDQGVLKINPVLNHDIYQILKYRDILD